MKVFLRSVVVASVLALLAGSASLVWAPVRHNRPDKCPWPACTDTCDPASVPIVTCIEKDGTRFQSTFGCCCCTPEAQHRSYLGPK